MTAVRNPFQRYSPHSDEAFFDVAHVNTNTKRYLSITWVVLIACLAGITLSFSLLSDTWLGFALAFGCGIVAYECIFVIRKLRASLSRRMVAI
jgi:hypothetical protein